MLLSVVSTASRVVSAETIHRDLEVSVHAEHTEFAVTDPVQLPGKTRSAAFSRLGGSTIEMHDAELEILGDNTDGHERHYRNNRLPPDGKVQLEYRGTITSRRTKGIFNVADSVFSAESIHLWVGD